MLNIPSALKGKARLLTKQDVCQRAGGAGDFLHTDLQLLLPAAQSMRFQQPLTATMTNSSSMSNKSPASCSPPPSFYNSYFSHNSYFFPTNRRRSPQQAMTSVEHPLGSHLLALSGSVTVSPAPSNEDGDSTSSGSPEHAGEFVLHGNHHGHQLPLFAAARSHHHQQQQKYGYDSHHQQQAALLYG